MTDFDIYLASASPRRKELLAQVGVRFQPVKAEIEEVRAPAESAREFVDRMAIEKASAGARLRPGGDSRPVLGADTIVVVQDQVLGKPRDREHGMEMLSVLSGTVHTVMTAVAVVNGGVAVRCSASQVTFRDIDEREILAYWNSGEPAGKAGAYAIQGLGAVFVSRLEGSYSGVVGLPLFETAQLLSDAGVMVITNLVSDQ